MTKFKKITGIALAGCMALSSLMMTAGAAEVPSEATTDATTLSEFAGETLHGNAYFIKSENDVSKAEFDISIPENATQEMVDILFSEAARQAVGLETRARATQRIELDSAWGVKVPQAGSTASYAELFNADLTRDYDYVEIDIVSTGGFRTMNFRVENESFSAGDTNRKVYQTNIDVEYGECTAIFYAGKKYGQGYMYLDAGDSISVYASGVLMDGYTGNASAVNGRLYGGIIF